MQRVHLQITKFKFTNISRYTVCITALCTITVSPSPPLPPPLPPHPLFVKCSDQLSAINYTVLHSGLQSHAYWNSISCDEAPGCSEHVLATDCHKPSDKVKAATNHKSSSGKETSLPRLSFMPPEDEQPQQQLDKQYGEFVCEHVWQLFKANLAQLQRQ